MRNRIAFQAVAAITLLSGLSLSQAGETFKTVSGKEYRDCEVIGKDPHGVTFRHAGGIAKLAYESLPKADRDRFSYDVVAAKAFVDSRRPKPAPVRQRSAKPATNAVERAAFYSINPRGRRNLRNPYSLTGSLHNPAAYGASFGGFIQPYHAGSFGVPSMVTSVPGGFFTRNTLRVSARPILDSPVATGLSSYSQVRDARAAAVRAAARATTKAVPRGRR